MLLVSENIKLQRLAQFVHFKAERYLTLDTFRCILAFISNVDSRFVIVIGDVLFLNSEYDVFYFSLRPGALLE